MLIWYVLRCDNGHGWEVLHDDTREFPREREVCEKDGLEAVTLQRMPPADRVRVTMTPAARVSDEVTGHVVLERRYLIEVAPWSGGDVLRSVTHYSWAEAVERAGWFENVTWDEARRLWERGRIS